ncbi:TadE/TadG family type IV pilus assembly protein [Curtobacterium sp. DN_7.5]|uniref:TadE/TadG family type IV pilus assembly protein n=1 Tax=Curtobacterium sp. DN_7.5 TaxID=3049047 RepID=UPI001F56F023|nr:TadE/TadG family type IV pilus assembly protein [Curtobacterium sp. DN_7.5]
MTVEFAVVLPAVALVLTLLVGAVVLVDRQGALQLAAATAARAAGRGDTVTAAAAVAAVPGATVAQRTPPGLVCVDLTRPCPGLFSGIVLRASGCAAEGGR